jgi:polyhydroxybutyrate depolymerase
VARREHFGVVFPDGLSRARADLRPNSSRALRTPPERTDDIAFISGLVEKFVADGRTDPQPVCINGRRFP